MSLTVKILEKQAGTLTKTAHAWLGGLITSETDGYVGTNCTLAYVTANPNPYRLLTGTAGTVMSADYDTGIACVEDDQIWFTARVSTSTAGVDAINLRITGTTGGSIDAATQANPVANTTYVLSGTATLTAAFTGDLVLKVSVYDASGATDTAVRYSTWHAINLTDQFGAGDEPLAADLLTFYEWRWELMVKKNRNLYNATYGDKMYYASKIATHGLEYNDVVKYTWDDGVGGPDYYYVSPVYSLNTDWVILQMNEQAKATPHESFDDNNTFEYWTKTDYTSSVRAKTLQVNLREDLDASASMSFNCTTTWQPELGMTVIIYDDTETLFTGHISQINKTKLAFGHWKADITVAPLLACLQWNIFLYANSNVDDLLTLSGSRSTYHFLEILAISLSGFPIFYTGGQAVWTGTLDDGNDDVNLPEPQYKTLYELFSSVCTSAGLALLMTADRRLKCVSIDRTPTDAPRNISDAAETDIFDMSYSEDISDYGSLAVMRGGYDSDGEPVIIADASTPPLTEAILGALSNKAIITSDSSIDNATDALAAATKQLYRHGTVIPGTLAFTTEYTDFRPGQKIEVDLDDLGIASTKTMLIDTVTVYDVDGKNLLSNVTCSNRDSTNFAAAPNKGSTTYMSELSNKVTSSVSALQQAAGTFTPTLYGATTAGTWAYTTQEGHYIRIGNLCYVSARINPSSIAGAAGNLAMGGLPFAVSASADRQFIPVFAANLSWTTSMTQLQLSLISGNSFGTFVGSGNNAAFGIVQTSDATAGDDIRISGCYQI